MCLVVAHRTYLLKLGSFFMPTKSTNIQFSFDHRNNRHLLFLWVIASLIIFGNAVAERYELFKNLL